jgi:mRNA interferase RelE/StbE
MSAIAVRDKFLDHNIALCDTCWVRTVSFTPAAARQWAKLSRDIRRRIDARLMEYASSGKGDVRRLKGAGSRLRVGDWRVIFDETRDAIIVVAVGHRREVYD